MLELAVLGLLHESPLHGYELRQRLKSTLGTFRAFSYGSLYPTLRRMKDAGWIAEDEGDAEVVAGAPPLTGRRGKVVYKLTADGKERLAELLAEAGPVGLGGRDLRRPLRVLRPDRPRGARAHPRGPAHPARGAARGRPLRPWPAPAHGSTATPSSCRSTGWSRWSARSAGSPS